MTMQLASMVHGSGREPEVYDHRRLHHHQHQTQQHPQHHPQQHHLPQQQHPSHPQHHQRSHSQSHSHYYSQPPQPRAYGAPAAAAQGPYPSRPSAAEQYQRPPQSPPSPPVEEQKPLLPSISSLLTIAGSERAQAERATQSPTSQRHPSPTLKQEQQRVPASSFSHRPSSPQHSDGRPDHVPRAFGSSAVSNARMTLPPTPPMHAEPAADGNQSPSAASTHSATPYFLGQSLNNMEPHQQRQHHPSAPVVKRHPDAPQSSMSPYTTSPYGHSPYASSPGGASGASYYSPEPHYNAGMYAQRPLPPNFDPQTMAVSAPGPPPSGPGLWQHHHYISASSQSAFPQPQERYVCPTCAKAFSRPSSLRIHSHSHTGEKPYKCTQPGCGKAFSVRSNMKRHERGCHASASTNTTAS
ncbi:hypothetical protein M011DRAFT_324414 [Sporormia fimetaria CBS 119925]|uniref:C2H2-type domain-containing protein n=1 Tax=Sporormia fimetaria CBS 119925 TaxID=1340428 RepID=A0A6A6VGY3_9PLEO|nr:hypothetical protein M011DRAFT_324414 [Sporormia fimetaria CBS 119925]